MPLAAPPRVVMAATALALFGLGACTDGTTEPAPGPSSTAPTPTDPESRPADGLRLGLVLPPEDQPISVLETDAITEAAQRLHTGVEVELAEVRIIQPPSEPFRRDHLELLVDEGYDVICTVGTDGADEILELARTEPAIRFCLVDGELVEPTPNAASVAFRSEEGAFLLGAAAALVGPAGSVGVVNGTRPSASDPVRVGFEAGARHVRPDIGFSSVPSTVDGPDGPLEDRSTARQAAASLLAGESPAQALLPLGGPATVQGVADAAAGDLVLVGWAGDLTAILEDADDRVLGSVVRDWDLALADVLTRLLGGGEPHASLGLTEDALSFLPGASPVYPAIAPRLQQTVADLMEGRVAATGSAASPG